ncbi:AAA family ATPase [Streptomyces sp. NBC_00354]|uniref:AAA family ATPase n=1 Tax=Streptomyces sp. NBC_00354 TaxID=2975723 RepID=UPI002E25E6F4|nr:MoxR family ATPase [Streptomyces sp. NBC_01001]
MTSPVPDEWHIYRGSGEPHDGIDRLPPPPPWRAFDAYGYRGTGTASRGAVYQVTPEIVQTVNAALYLRRPLLVTGPPGSGKSSLAYQVAHELRLGAVLNWPITSRSTLRDGLYAYDALGRLQDANLSRHEAPEVGRYLQLGPLGTALLPSPVPRVLLIDEIDKSDPDLPNDLLNVFEEGQFVIPELARLAETEASVRVYDTTGDTVVIDRGRVRARAFPFTVLTSNGERAFPPAFLRRCLRLDLPAPNAEQLLRIVQAHLGPEAVHQGAELIRSFVDRRETQSLSTDQLLNALFLFLRDRSDGEPFGSPELKDQMLHTVLRRLD